jgi:hypothetical protein
MHRYIARNLRGRLSANTRPAADRRRSELERELERELATYARSARLCSWTHSAFDGRS